MDKREEVLREALGKNEEEIQRWETYVKDNKTAINNLNTFSKRLTVDVMVPIGRKAYIPGRLIHTNEVMVGHYQDYFSKCSAFTATEICKKRIENGKTHLEQLKAEKDLFQNKLEKPYLEGVLPNTEEREIIEEYDEEKEKVWREKHRQRVKEAKLKEKQQRQAQLNKENAHDELIQTLEEEEEMLKELNQDLAGREPATDQDSQVILKKLMSGEMNLPPPKKRIAHSATKRDDSVQLKPVEAKMNQSVTNHVGKPSDKKFNFINSSELITDDNESDTSVASDTPEEIRLIEKQAEYLLQEDRIGFYQYQLQIIDQKIVTCSFSNNKELEHKLHLFKIRDHLEELIEILEEAASSETDSQANEHDKETTEEKSADNPPKRRISFALEDQMLEFRKNETVAEMLPTKSPTEEKPQRDIIRLDEPIVAETQPDDTGENDSNRLVDRRKTILEKVEENLKTQSLEDVDLVNKIIDSSVNRIQTLHIHFKHSTESTGNSDDVSPQTEVPRSPADLYRMFRTEENTDPPIKENERNFYLKEADRDRAYVDVRAEFLSPVSSENSVPTTQSRSILKNKSAVDREIHITEPDEKPKPAQQKKMKKPKDDVYLTAYNKVMSDVIENPSIEPDPLPVGKFVDMHTPKKRISRFKQMRNENK